MESRALHVLELPKVLSYLAGFAVSEAGERACLALRPLENLEDIRREAALFEEGRLWALAADARLTAFPPLEGLLRQAQQLQTVLDLDDLFALRQVLGMSRRLAESMLEGEKDDRWPLWTTRCREASRPDKTVAALHRCLAEDGRLRDEASPELLLVRSELRQLHQQCIRKVKDYAAEYNILHYLQDAFMTLSSDRYVLPLKANFKGRLQGVIHDYSQTGETCYFEPLFLVDINNRLQGLKREEREEERKILVYLTSLVREELSAVRAMYEFLVELDLLLARCGLAACYDGRMLEFDASRGVHLKEARHPLLALASSAVARKALAAHLARREDTGISAEDPDDRRPRRPEGPDVPVVASSLELEPEQRALVISGGNAGGKTVSLKTLGLTALMGMCALPVPAAAGSSLPLWTDIHAFIGDEQSLDDHVSTYTAQITHLARIWPRLGPDSLVILDEFGAGTDPSQGAALAQAVVDSLMEQGAYVVAATHFPALKAYALSTPRVRAASVLFDPRTKKPLFKLVYDQVGASQALDVAREHGLPEVVLRRAEQYLLVSGEDTSSLVERLNSLAVEREKELADLLGERQELERRRIRLEERFVKEREELFGRIQGQARDILEQWKKGRASHKQALRDLARVRAELVAPAPGDEPASAALDLADVRVGQRVRHVPWKREGRVVEVDERKGRVCLNLDGVTLWAAAKDLAPVCGNGRSGAETGTSRGVSTTIASTPLPLHLDLRGMRADVARSELEKFLDNAILKGRADVEVVHGRGTGALRRELHAFLKEFPAVASFRLAPEDRGGDGMTIVELK